MGTGADFVNAGAAPTRANENPAAIEEEIEQTRHEMDQTIGAIQDRLTPERLADQAVGAASEITIQARDAAKDAAQYAIGEAKSAVRELAGQAQVAAREATVGRIEQMATYTRDTTMHVQRDLFSLIRQNPIPAAMVAIGIGWLWTSRSGSPGATARDYGYASYGHERDWQTEAASRAGGLAQDVSDQAQQMAGQAQEMAGQAQHAAGQTIGQVQDTAGRVQQQARSTMEGIAADPVALGAVGLMFGAAAGFLLPESEPETRIFGEARAMVAERAQEVAGQTVETVQRVAADVGQTAMRDVQGAMAKTGTSANTSST